MNFLLKQIKPNVVRTSPDSSRSIRSRIAMFTYVAYVAMIRCHINGMQSLIPRTEDVPSVGKNLAIKTDCCWFTRKDYIALKDDFQKQKDFIERSMPNPNISTQDWYYHPPRKNSTHTEALEPPPASQIPGLSNIIDQPDEMEERQFRRKWLRDTDSKYIRLAKGGGRKNLLSYNDPSEEPQQPVGYPRVDWFDHYQKYPESEGPNPTPPPAEFPRSKKMQPRTEPHRVLPEWYTHDLHVQEENQIHDHSNPEYKKKNIVSFDSMSAWEREAQNEEAEYSKRVKLPPLIIGTKQTNNKPATNFQQFPKRIARPSNKMDSEGTVDFGHLIGMGYQRDWFKEQSIKYNDEKKKKELERLQHDEKRSTQLRDAIQMRRPKNNATQSEETEMFKLSRFQKIQPRVESFRT